MSLSPTTGPSWKPESRVLADAHAVLPPTEVNLLGPAQDQEGQRMGLGVGGSEHVGWANRIDSTDGGTYMASQGRSKRCHMWFAFYLIFYKFLKVIYSN